LRPCGRRLNSIPLLVLCLACNSGARETDAAYLVVIDSVARMVPAGSSACFASRFYPEGRQALPESLRDSRTSLVCSGGGFRPMNESNGGVR